MTMTSDGRIVMEKNLVPTNPARKFMKKEAAIADGKKVRARMEKAAAILAGKEDDEEPQELPDAPVETPKKKRSRKIKE